MSDQNRPRREFLKDAGIIASVSATATAALAQQPAQQATDTPQRLAIEFTLNRQPVKVEVDSRTTLLDLLREKLKMTETKKGCDQGACGACTVLIDSKRVLACLTLAATLSGKHVTTLKGISAGDELHPLQEAFLRCDAYQCGYCTPGQIMSGVACIQEGHANKSVEETREWMSGNLCRCSAYTNIVSAIRQTAGAETASDPAELVTRFDVTTSET